MGPTTERDGQLPNPSPAVYAANLDSPDLTVDRVKGSKQIAMLTQTEQQQDQNQRERFTVNGWNLGQDDDSPRPPEVSPLDSGQARRAWRNE